MSSGGWSRFHTFYLVFTVARGFAQLLLPLYFVSVGIPVLGVGVAIGVFGVGLLVFEVLWGVLLDRAGPKSLVLVAVVTTAGSYFMLPFVKTSEGAIAVEFVLGATAPIVTLVARSNVVRRGESGSWAGGFGLLGSLYSFSQLIGSLLGSFVAPFVGLSDSFYVAGALCAGGYAYHLLGERQQTVVVQAPEVKAEAPPSGPRPRLDWRGLPLLGLVAVPTFIIFSFFTNIIQLVVTETHAISASESEAGIVVSSFWLSTTIFQPLIARRAAKSARKWIGVAMLCAFAVFALMTQLYNVWEVAAGVFLAGICYSSISPLSLSLLMVGIPARYAGRAIGVYGAAEDVGVILGPLVGSAVWVEYGLTQAYLTLGATFLLVLIPYGVALRSLATRPNR